MLLLKNYQNSSGATYRRDRYADFDRSRLNRVGVTQKHRESWMSPV